MDEIEFLKSLQSRKKASNATPLRRKKRDFVVKNGLKKFNFVAKDRFFNRNSVK